MEVADEKANIRVNLGVQRSDMSNNETQVSDQPHGPEEPAKESLTAWLQVLAAFVLNLNTWGMMNAYGVFQTFYQLDRLRSYDSTTIAWIGSTQGFLLFLVSIIAGPIFDRGYFRSLLWVGSALIVIGLFLVSIATQYWQLFLLQSLIMGFGFGCLYLPAPAIVSQYFNASTALAIGASSAGSAIGGIVYPIAFTQIQPKIGFGWATRVLAFILLATSLIPLLVMKSKSRPGTTRSIIDRKAFKDLPYMLLNLGLCFGFMGIYIIFYFIQLFALSRVPIATSLADNLVVILNAASLPGRLISGYCADRIGPINVQTLVALTSAILTFSLFAIRTEAALLVYMILYGFFAGAFMGLPAAGIVRLCDDGSKIGTRIGMTLAFVGFGVLVSNPIAGAILGRGNNWVGLVSWCGALLVASSLMLIASRIVKVGAAPTKVI
ncbi:MFS general substrate transporter [Daldinia eschscholtzii]|nr:MFS general substrate transporter [Daldinia eschscholtzii]